MPKEMDTGLWDLRPPQPPKNSNLVAASIATVLIMLLVWWALLSDPYAPTPEPPRPFLVADLPPPAPPILRPPPAPPRPLTELDLLEQLSGAATEQLWTARAAVLIIGLGVLGIFTVSRRLKQLINRHDREIDLLMGAALGQQRDLLAQLGEGLAERSRRPSWDDTHG